jgi:hypothetical protein
MIFGNEIVRAKRKYSKDIIFSKKKKKLRRKKKCLLQDSRTNKNLALDLPSSTLIRSSLSSICFQELFKKV